MTIEELPEVVHGHPRHWVNWIMNIGSAKSVDEALVILQLLEAIEQKNQVAVKAILGQGVDPNMKLPGQPLLELAVNSGDPQMVRALLDAGAYPNAGNALSSAINYDQTESVGMLIGAGAKLKEGMLAFACTGGSAKMVRLLLDRGADANDARTCFPTPNRRADNCTALMMAADSANPAVAKMLLAAGAEVTRRDSNGCTALDWARAKKSKRAEQVVDLLENAGAVTGSVAPTVAPDFENAAKSQEFQQAIARVQEVTGVRAGKIELEEGPLKGGKAFIVKEETARAVVDQLRDECQRLHSTIFVSRDIANRNGWCVGLVSTADVFEAIAAICIVADIAWLKELQQGQPFELSDIGVDFLRGRFTTPITDPTDLAKRMHAFCPDIVDQGCGTVEVLAAELTKSPAFFFWWD